MAASKPPMQDPALLMEAARVFNAVGAPYQGITEAVNSFALNVIDQADLPIRYAVLGDAAALRLSGRVAGGSAAALKLLEPIEPKSPPAATERGRKDFLRLFLLRALANGQQYKALWQPLADRTPELATRLAALRERIFADLKLAGREWVASARPLWIPAAAAPLAAAAQYPVPEDDLALLYLDDPQAFEALLDGLAVKPGVDESPPPAAKAAAAVPAKEP